MDETFENRPILDSQTLRVLKQRRDLPSLLRLTLHLGAFFLGATCVVLVSRSPILASASGLLLAAIWAALFAPFHECTHLTAFRSRQLNVLGAWLTGPLFWILSQCLSRLPLRTPPLYPRPRAGSRDPRRSGTTRILARGHFCMARPDFRDRGPASKERTHVEVLAAASLEVEFDSPMGSPRSKVADGVGDPASGS